ncbi:MAG: hypothetical protein WBL44_01335 [Nitrososphaeraceae archaeon]
MILTLLRNTSTPSKIIAALGSKDDDDDNDGIRYCRGLQLH